MRLTRTWLAALGLVCLAWVSSAAVAQAAPMSFTVPLSGTQAVPAITTSGTGSADLTYDPSTRMLTWTVTYSGLSSPATMAHFHGPAPAGKNAGVMVWISKKGVAPTSPIKGSAKLTVAQAKALMAGDMYINVHTKMHPAGEIRGQVVPPKA